MRNSLRSKLILSYLAIAVLTAVAIYVLIQATSGQRLKALILEQQIVELQQQVASWYASEGTWNGFSDYFVALHPPPVDAIAIGEGPGGAGAAPPLGAGGPPTGRGPGPGSGGPGPGGGPPPPPVDAPTTMEMDGAVQTQAIGMHGLVDADRRVLVRFRSYMPNEVVPEPVLSDAVPVEVQGETIAWIIPDSATGISLQSEETIYLQRTNQVVLGAGALAVVAALLMGMWFAQVLLRPIFALTAASEEMAQGKLKQQVAIHTNDELGQLAESFNSMSHQVAVSQQQRRQLTADIAHDLGTPLQIISGYVETIQDGTLAPTPERMGIIATEVGHLHRLIQDLNTLVQTDTQTLSLDLEPVALDEYLPRFVSSFKPLADEQKVALQLDTLPSALPQVQADQARLTQVLANLLSNALRYTPTGGNIQIAVRALADAAQIRVRDSGVGIDPSALPFVFDRFYQSDQARSSSGKMGLGLAISKGLVEAMGGEISAESPGQNQGATFVITLPT